MLPFATWSLTTEGARLTVTLDQSAWWAEQPRQGAFAQTTASLFLPGSMDKGSQTQVLSPGIDLLMQDADRRTDARRSSVSCEARGKHCFL